MKRGDIWTVSGAGYAGKPRPALLVQNDALIDTASVTICSFTSAEPDADYLRILIEPKPENGLALPSRLMVDKITTVAKTKLGKRLGALGDVEMAEVDHAILLHLGLG